MAKPFVKWAGGKEKELKYIYPNMPEKINDFFEPFVGGGAVYLSLENHKELNIKSKYINDKSVELIDLYKNITESNKDFLEYLKELNSNWKLLTDVVNSKKEELLSFYKGYKNNLLNDITLRDSINNFIFSNTEMFNGMLHDDFNVKIDTFYAEVVNALIRKIKRTIKIDEQNEFFDDNILGNLETAFKSAFYTHFRNLYNQRARDKELQQVINDKRASAIFYFIREFCYASMFRYNSKGDFNVPYGGMAYNKKNLDSKLMEITNKTLISYLNDTEIFNLDFEDFVKVIKPKKNDFIFLDPPYDTEFSDYAKNSFDKNDQIRLAEFLYKTKANFMLIIKDTPYIRSLYENHGFNIIEFQKTYMVNFQNRNDRNVTHLLIKNY